MKPSNHGDRRDFFRRILLKGMTRVEQAGRSVGLRLPGGDGDGTSDVHPTGEVGRNLLRPPGALDETAFVQTCSRCGDCVRVCPAQCIVIDEAIAGGLPHIEPRRSPCVVCEDLSCMKACPTGALSLVESAEHIQMGRAEVDHPRCLRNSPGEAGGVAMDADSQAQPCRLCVDDCPLGSEAIGIDNQSRVEIRSGCVGCGVCERVCPTQPASVTVNALRLIDVNTHHD